MTNYEAISRYCSYFEGQIERVGRLDQVLYRKILLVVIFDTLARARYPDETNKGRFVRLTDEFANWPDGQRVSLPQLAFLLEAASAGGCGELMREVKRRLEEWQYGRIYRLSVDPLVSEVEAIAASADEQRAVANSRHSALLYTYRNHLLHEFREPGYAIEISDDNSTPYYHGMTTLEGVNSWELVYPIGFLLHIVRSSLASLRRYFLENDIDPYSLYQFGSIWSRR